MADGYFKESSKEISGMYSRKENKLFHTWASSAVIPLASPISKTSCLPMSCLPQTKQCKASSVSAIKCKREDQYSKAFSTSDFITFKASVASSILTSTAEENYTTLSFTM